MHRSRFQATSLPVPHQREKKVKSETPSPAEKVKFPTPPAPEKVKSETPKPLESSAKSLAKVVDTKERKDKEASASPVFLSSYDGATAPEDEMISPEVARKFGLRYNVADWPPSPWCEV